MYMDKRYQVFISSTFTDLREERKEVIQKLLNANYIPAGMEMFNAANDEQFSYIKKIIDTCDYYVLILGARYGSINPSTGKSFTEQEYDYAVEKGIPVLAFVHDDPYNLPAEKRDDDKRKELESFRTKVMNGRLCQLWRTPVDLISSVIISLGEEVANNPQLGWTRGNRGEIDSAVDFGEYYVLNVPRTIHPNNQSGSCLWYKKDSKGYVYELNDAKKFSCFELLKLFHNKYELKKFVAIPVGLVDEYNSNVLPKIYIEKFRNKKENLFGNKEIYLSDDEISMLK